MTKGKLLVLTAIVAAIAIGGAVTASASPVIIRDTVTNTAL